MTTALRRWVHWAAICSCKLSLRSCIGVSTGPCRFGKTLAWLAADLFLPWCVCRFPRTQVPPSTWAGAPSPTRSAQPEVASTSPSSNVVPAAIGGAVGGQLSSVASEHGTEQCTATKVWTGCCCAPHTPCRCCCAHNWRSRGLLRHSLPAPCGERTEGFQRGQGRAQRHVSVVAIA